MHNLGIKIVHVCILHGERQFYSKGGGGGGGWLLFLSTKSQSKTSSLKLLISYNIIRHMYINYYVCTCICIGANRSA